MAEGGNQAPRAFAPDVSKIETVDDLARVLRHLRRRHARRRGDSELTYREMAAKVGWSHAVIGEYFAGKALPPTDRFDVLIRLLGASPAELGVLATARDRVEEGRRVAPPPPPAEAPPPPVPRQLPADVYGFTGREAHLAELDGRLRSVAAGSGMGISVLSGTAGVGKTALAVHWAHQVADQFPDGQLYVNLRGFDPGGSAVEPTEAIRGFLDALAVPAPRIPACLSAQVGLYRSLLADKRVLILLDNASDAEQVRPLLPGAPGCLVLVTSRSQLSGLVAVDGARSLAVDLLSPAEAWQLLTRRLGADRLGAEPRAVDEIIARCARLPLALTIVAARAASHPNFPLAASAVELRDAGSGLEAFAGGDEVTDVRAVLSWSYKTLSEPAARLFRLLGLHAGPDISAPAAASLAGEPIGPARRLLGELTRSHLLTEHSPGRYTRHDLLRAYAAELARTEASDEERRAARHRVLDHYLRMCDTAAQLLNPYREATPPVPAQASGTPEHLADDRQAMAWFVSEHSVVLAAITEAAAAGFDTHAWQLASALGTYCQLRGLWGDQVDIQTVALEATRRLGDRYRQASAHRDIGRAHLRLGHYDDADVHFRSALGLWEALGNDLGTASIYNHLAEALDLRDRSREALEYAQRALRMYRAAGYDSGEAWSLNAIGWMHARLGDHESAVSHCEQALALQSKLDDRHGQAATLDSLGYAHHHLGQYDRAVSCYGRALELIREVGDRYQEADILRHLARAYSAAGPPGAARRTWEQALQILDELDHPDADDIRAELRQMDRPAHEEVVS